jgi:hypothetical protein
VHVFTVRPIAQTDTLAASAQPVIDAMAKAGVFQHTTAPATWLLDLLQRRSRGEVSLATACEVTRQVLIQIAPSTLGFQFVCLAVIESLGRVDTTTLNTTCLTGLVSQSLFLDDAARKGRLKSQADLLNAANARLAALRAACSPQPIYADFLTQIARALTVFIPTP